MTYDSCIEKEVVKMDSLNRKNQIPKLYITQPKITEPNRTMQSHFHSAVKHTKSETKDYPKGSKKRSKRNRPVDSLDEEKTSEKKKFKDMTLKEKVMHFAKMPFHAPRVKCQVVTERKTYIGIITDYHQDMVVMRVASKNQPVSIPFKQISEINLVGF